jgi:hypothetical protein
MLRLQTLNTTTDLTATTANMTETTTSILEGMLYNAPSEKFGGSYNSTVAACINWLLETDRTQLICANEQCYLLRDGTQVTWTESECSKFLTATCELWREW